MTAPPENMPRDVERMSHTVTAEYHGQRLDHALWLLAPGMGLRGRRRLWSGCRVLVDGRERKPAFRVRQGQEIRLEPLSTQAFSQPELRIIARSPEFLAVYKDGNTHSAHVAGNPEPSMEAALVNAFQNQTIRLLNRLDHQTSGILLAALDEQAARRYQEEQDADRTVKLYLAVVQGIPEQGLVLDRELDATSRLVKAGDGVAAPDRWTTVERVVPMEQGLAMIRVRILRGVRHQIRAHLALAGHPILGDQCYGGPVHSQLHLHHCLFSMPGFIASCEPPWQGQAAELAVTLLQEAMP